MVYFILLFIIKVADNAISTAKTIFVQRNQKLLAGISLTISTFMYYYVIKMLVSTDSNLAIFVVSLASGLGCYFAILVNDKLSKDRTYINIILSDNRASMQELRDFLALNHITNVTTDSYTKDWNVKTIAITAYAETKAQSKLIDNYIAKSDGKFKRIIRGEDMVC